MQPRRTNDRTPARRARRLPALVGLSAVLLLGACGASGSDTSGKVDLSDIDDPTETTVAADDGSSDTTDTEPAADPAGGDLCVAVSRVLLAPVVLDENQEEITDDEGLDAIALIADEVPDDLAAGWADYLDLVEASLSGEEVEPDDERVGSATTTLEDSFVWGTEACPDLPPAWACPTQSSFESVGEPVDPPEPAETPEDALYDPEGAVELDRTDDAVLFGWLDDDGLVIEVTEVTREGEGWLGTDSAACR